MSGMKPIDLGVTYVPGFLENLAQNPQDWYNCLMTDLDWERRTDAPRYEYWTNIFDQPYTYGRGRGERTYASRPNHTIVQMSRIYFQHHYGVFFEGCFLNRYDDARDHLGWHADDDPYIDHSKPIAIITLGTGRNIQFRKLGPIVDGKQTFDPPTTTFLENGSLCFMGPGFQFTHQHRIPKASTQVGPRISLTFRSLLRKD